jgi:hypothetical protein
MNQHPPREEEFYIALGDAWKNSGNSKAAVGAFEQAVRIKPKSVTALRSFAASLKTSGECLTKRADIEPRATLGTSRR